MSKDKTTRSKEANKAPGSTSSGPEAVGTMTAQGPVDEGRRDWENDQDTEDISKGTA